MTPEETMVAAIQADATVTGLIGSKLYADEISPRATQPFAVYQRGNTAPVRTIGSRLVGSFVEITILVYSKSRSNVDAICNAIDGALRPEQFLLQERVAGFEAEPQLESARMTYRYWHSAS